MCDNSAIVDAINNRSIRSDAINPLQLLFLTAALYDIDISACWLSSEDNWIADSLSRFDFKRLTNFQLDRLFDLSRREPGTPMFKLRQRLQAYFGTDLLQVPDLHTPSPEPNTSHLHNITDTNPSGSPNQSPKWKQSRRHISQANTAVPAGILTDEVKGMGHWKSDAVRYSPKSTTQAQLFSANRRLQVAPSSSTSTLTFAPGTSNRSRESS